MIHFGHIFTDGLIHIKEGFVHLKYISIEWHASAWKRVVRVVPRPLKDLDLAASHPCVLVCLSCVSCPHAEPEE